MNSSRRSTTRPSDHDQLRVLRREVARLRRENELQRNRLEVLAGLVAVLRLDLPVDVRARLVHERREAGIGWLCRVMGIERTRFFRWRRSQETRRERTAAENDLAERIVEIHTRSAGTYGAARVTVALRRQGLVVNRKRVAHIMRERGIQGVTRRRRRSLTRPDGKPSPAPDLLKRDFTAAGPRTRLVGDITCVSTFEG